MTLEEHTMAWDILDIKLNCRYILKLFLLTNYLIQQMNAMLRFLTDLVYLTINISKVI